MTRKKKVPVKTITCQHCRYERPADDARCHLCGYPWAFADCAKKVSGKRTRK